MICKVSPRAPMHTRQAADIPIAVLLERVKENGKKGSVTSQSDSVTEDREWGWEPVGSPWGARELLCKVQLHESPERAETGGRARVSARRARARRGGWVLGENRTALLFTVYDQEAIEYVLYGFMMYKPPQVGLDRSPIPRFLDKQGSQALAEREAVPPEGAENHREQSKGGGECGCGGSGHGGGKCSA